METGNQNGTSRKRLYSIKELSAEIGGTVWFWRERIWAGEIPVVRFGRKQFVDFADVEQFIERNKMVYGGGA